MTDRLFVAVIGDRNSGKTTTWNELFGHVVRTGKEPRDLELYEGHKTKVFLISGSNEERKQYAVDVLEDVDCRIVLCSVQYTKESFASTWDYVFEQRFAIFAQWLNPGFASGERFDWFGLMNVLLDHDAVVSVRDGRAGQSQLTYRVEEIRQFIAGWAASRRLAYLD